MIKKEMNDSNDEKDYVNENSPQLTLSAIKDFLTSRGGKAKYADLFEQFRSSIVDSTSGKIS